jgi:hypothetical protein
VRSSPSLVSARTLPEDAIYPINLADDTGKPLDGADRYVLHFESSAILPVNAFWSVTLYDAEGYQVPTTAVSSWMPFAYDPDGSLDLISTTKAAATRRRTGCRRRKGPFNLAARLYAPKSDALIGEWNPPPVMKAPSPTLLPAQ